MYRKNVGRRVALLLVAVLAGGVFADAARQDTIYVSLGPATLSRKNAVERDR